MKKYLNGFFITLLVLCTMGSASAALNHQIVLPDGKVWCDDGKITTLLDGINSFRATNGLGPLPMDALGMKDAELRAVQFANYMATHSTTDPGFNPHEGYDTTARSIGYTIVSENLAHMASDPNYVVALWQTDALHRGAMLYPESNVAGVSCIIANGRYYWTFEPGRNAAAPQIPTNNTPPATPTPGTTPTPSTPTTDLHFVGLHDGQSVSGIVKITAAMSASLRGSDVMRLSIDGNGNYPMYSEASGYTAYLSADRLSSGEHLLRVVAVDEQGKTHTASLRLTTGGATPTTPPSTPPATPPTGANSSLDSQELEFLTLLNQYRAQNGVPALNLSPRLQQSAEWMSHDMATKRYVEHTDSLGRTAGERIASFNYTYGWGENILAGFTTAQEALDAWKNACDPDASGSCTYAHRRNMLNANFRAIGISRDASGMWYWVTDFGTVLDGSSASVPSTPDTTPPSAPVLQSAQATDRVELTWSASNDDVGVVGYQVLRNGTILATVSALHYADAAVTGGATYRYEIVAYDAAGHRSKPSNARTVKIAAQQAPVCDATAATCRGGTITSNVPWLSGCRAIECEGSGDTYMEVYACKRTDSSGAYLELYKHRWSDVPPQVCVGNLCIQEKLYVKAAC